MPSQPSQPRRYFRNPTICYRSSQLERDVAAWEARARATYLADCQGLKDIWAGFCSQDWEPGDEGEQRAAGIAVADPIKDTMRAAIDGVLNDAPALEARVKALADKRETQKLGKSLQRELKKQQERLVKLRANPALNGNYDLMLQFSNAYGKQQHERMWKEYSCKVPVSATKPADFPREGKPHYKPDCIEPESCMIWEFKPKGKAGEARGEAQRDSYQHNVPTYYNKLVKLDGTYVAAEASLGGIEIMNRLMQRCYVNGAIKLTAAVQDYDPCKEAYECTTD